MLRPICLECRQSGLHGYQITGISVEKKYLIISARYEGQPECPHCASKQLRSKGRYLRRICHEDWGLF